MIPARHAAAALEQRARKRINRRLMPILFILYIIAFLDRINIGFAGLDMTRELGFSDRVFGFGAGVFFFGYVLLEVPGTLLVELWSARKWIARIMISWGFVAALTGFIHTAAQFYWARFLLGLAEAGFFPGLVVYLTHWYRDEDRGKAMGTFIASTAVASTIGAPISGLLMRLHWFGLSGWRWLLILEGLPAIIFGIVTFFYLTDWPKDAAWLPEDEKDWIMEELEREKQLRARGPRVSVWQTFHHPYVILLTAIYFLGNAAQYGFGLWLPKLIQAASGFSTFKVAMIASLPFLISLPAMLLVGWNSDRTGERRWHTAVAYMLAGAGLAGSLWAGNRIIPGMVMFSIAAIGLNSRLPAFWALPHTFLGGTAAAASIGIINCIGGLGGFFGPYMLGALSTDRGNYSAGVWLLTGVSLLAAALVLLLRQAPEKRPV
jgi:MFS transporter, ACS family, tartrate transporter